MKNLTWKNPEQLVVAQVLINKVKSKCCGIKDIIKPTEQMKEDFAMYDCNPELLKIYQSNEDK